MATSSQLYTGTAVRSHSGSRPAIGTVALWVVQVLTAGMFVRAGSVKLTGDPMMVQFFDALGPGQWFRYLTGGIEIAAAALLLVPRAAVFGALLLVPTMIGAILSHALIGGSVASAAILLVASSTIAWFRRGDLAAVLTAIGGTRLAPRTE
ncbi:MAG TPA: DoxX family protein [Vicinamibacterales bacterium]